MPGRRCAVAACNNSWIKTKGTNADIIYHSFPLGKDVVSAKTRNEWIACCKRANKFNPSTSQICSIHFTEYDYKRDLQHELLGLPLRRVLLKTAVPTMNLEPKDVDNDNVAVKAENDIRETHSAKRRRKQVFVNISTSKKVKNNVVKKAQNDIQKSHSLQRQKKQIGRLSKKLMSSEDNNYPDPLSIKDQDLTGDPGIDFEEKYSQLVNIHNKMKTKYQREIKQLKAKLRYYQKKANIIKVYAMNKTNKEETIYLKIMN